MVTIPLGHRRTIISGYVVVIPSEARNPSVTVDAGEEGFLASLGMTNLKLFSIFMGRN
jgi:hypothetical protein